MDWRAPRPPLPLPPGFLGCVAASVTDRGDYLTTEVPLSRGGWASIRDLRRAVWFDGAWRTQAGTGSHAAYAIDLAFGFGAFNYGEASLAYSLSRPPVRGLNVNAMQSLGAISRLGAVPTLHETGRGWELVVAGSAGSVVAFIATYFTRYSRYGRDFDDHFVELTLLFPDLALLFPAVPVSSLSMRYHLHVDTTRLRQGSVAVAPHSSSTRYAVAVTFRTETGSYSFYRTDETPIQNGSPSWFQIGAPVRERATSPRLNRWLALTETHVLYWMHPRLAMTHSDPTTFLQRRGLREDNRVSLYVPALEGVLTLSGSVSALNGRLAISCYRDDGYWPTYLVALFQETAEGLLHLVNIPNYTAAAVAPNGKFYSIRRPDSQLVDFFLWPD